MASHKKFKGNVAYKILNHIERHPHTYRNKDVDTSKSHLNTVIMDNGFEYYKRRLDEIHHTRRKDLVTLCGVVVTLPKTLNYLTVEEQDSLFYEITMFLIKRYGKDNAVNAVVHRDEAGQPHLHFTFIPATKNDNINANMVRVVKYLNQYPQANNSQVARALGISRKTVIRWRPMADDPRIFKEKLSAFEVLNRNELKSFHPDLKKWLNERVETDNGEKIGDHFVTGVTALNGGNLTIEQLKSGDVYREQVNEIKTLKTQIRALEQEVADLRRELEVKNEEEVDRGKEKLFSFSKDDNEFEF